MTATAATARPRPRRTSPRRCCGAGRAHADTVDHQVDRAVFRCLLARIIASGDADIVQHAEAESVGLGDARPREAFRSKHLRDEHADGAAAKDDDPGIRCCAGTGSNLDSTHRHRCRLSNLLVSARLVFTQ